MSGPNSLEPLPAMPAHVVAQLRDEYAAHVAYQLDGSFCRRCGERFPCRRRLEIQTWLVAAGYKTEVSLLDMRMPLADEMYLLLFSHIDGKPLHPARVVGAGLGAALLAELMLAGNVCIRGGYVVWLPGPAPADEVASCALLDIQTEPQRHPTRTWVEFLGRRDARSPRRGDRDRDVAQLVAQRLAGRGILRPQRHRRTVVWEPVNMATCSRSAGRLRAMVQERHHMELPDVVLVELAHAVGLDQHVLGAVDDRGRHHQQTQADRLPAEYHQLVATTKEVVGAALQSPRR